MTFATAEDERYCRELHRRHGTTYYFASLSFPPHLRRRVHALYGFVREPDEWVDNPNGRTTHEQQALLDRYRSEMRLGCEGQRPTNAAMRAFVDLLQETNMPLAEPMEFLDAMEMDLTHRRYPSYGDLMRYMRGSAAAVGVMMCWALGIPDQDGLHERARMLGNAMQMTNFLRDVAEDAGRGRIYLPLEDLETFGVRESDILDGRFTPEFAALMRFEIARTKALYAEADPGIMRLPPRIRRPIRLARVLYAQILDEIEAQDHNVFLGRARTSRSAKLAAAVRIWMGA